MSYWGVVNPNVTSLLTLLIIGLSTSVMADTHHQRDPSDLRIYLFFPFFLNNFVFTGKMLVQDILVLIIRQLMNGVLSK